MLGTLPSMLTPNYFFKTAQKPIYTLARTLLA